jgi:cell division ATPase FtsA
MLEYQATRQLPFLKEDITTGYKILEVFPDGYSKVALVIVQKNIINNYYGLLKSAGISPDCFCLSTEATLSWFLNDVGKTEKVSSDFYMLVDIDYKFTELLICQGSNIIFSRAFAHGAGALYKLDTEIEISHWIKALTDEMYHTLKAFKKEKAIDAQPVKRIYISGGVSNFSQQINKYLHTEFSFPVEYINALRVLKSSKDIDLPSGLIERPISFSSVIGMVSNKQDFKIDLLPKEIKERRSNRQKQLAITKIYILAAAILASLFVLASARFYYKKAYINYLDRQILQMQPRVEKAELVIEKTGVFKKQSDKNATPLEFLKEIYRVMPAEVKLSNFSFQENKAIVLRGSCNQMSVVFEMVPQLEKSKYFKNVKVAFTNKRKISNGEVVDFQINCFLKTGA